MGTYVHADKTQGEDDSVCILEFETGAKGMIENSWARHGGMEDRVEVYGSEGLTYADLHMGNALPTYSQNGYGYAVEKAPSTQGWTWPVYEELWNYGFPQEMHHFARCVRGKETPQATGEDGRFVQEVLYAGYRSAGIGAKVAIPYRPTGVQRPIDLWLAIGMTTIIAVLALLTIIPNALTGAELAIEWDGSQADFFSDTDGPFTLGFQFGVESDIAVTALGAFDHLGDGLETAHTIGIWMASGGAPIATVTVPSGTVGSLVGQFRYVDIAGLSLSADTVHHRRVRVFRFGERPLCRGRAGGGVLDRIGHYLFGASRRR